MFGAADAVNDKLKEKISTEKLESAGSAALEKFKSLSPTLTEKADAMTAKFQSGVVDMMKAGIKKYAPDFKDEWTDDLLGLFFDGYGKDDLIEKGTEKAQNWAQDAIESKISEYLQDAYDDMLKSQMKELAEMIQENRFDVTMFEFNREVAKQSFTDLRARYLKAHEVSYNVSGIKDSVDLFNNTIGEAGKITGFWKAQAEAFEKGYKAVRSGILNNVEIYYWFDAYGGFMKEVRGNIDQALGVAMAPFENPERAFSFSLIPVAHAEAPIAEPTSDELATYKESSATLSFFESMEDVNDLFLEVFPEDMDVIAVKEMVTTNAKEAQEKLENLPPTVAVWDAQTARMNELDEDGDGELTLKDVTGAEWAAMGFVLALGFLVLWGIIKLIKKIFRRKK